MCEDVVAGGGPMLIVSEIDLVTLFDGGLKGLQFTPQSTFPVGGTLNAMWVANADFLAEPYKGSDAYVTKDGLMYAQVTTFDGAKLKFKK